MVVSVQQEKRLLWHPRRDNKFVVGGGSQITLYEWAPESPEIRHVTSQHDLQFMKCFAWSPDPAFDDLVAVGHSTGRVDLMRLEATKLARNQVLSSGPVVSLPTRNSRSCNALAFCSADPNYLAVGLDKVRSDSSLVIWDIQSSSSMLSLTQSALSTTAVDGPAESPPRPQPHIPRADMGTRADSRILQQHAPTEVVSCIAFLPQSTSLLFAGISYRWLRLFDLRSSIPHATSAPVKVNGIATDPFDAHRLASFGDGVISIWDARRLSNPLLTFTERDASADGARPRSNSVFTTVEFSSTRRGMLATLERDATSVRFWDTQQAQNEEALLDGERLRDTLPSGRVHRRSWANLPWGTSSGSNIYSGDLPNSLHNLVLSDTRKTRYFNSPLSSFALVPSPQSHPLASNIMIVNKDGDLELYAVYDTPKMSSWSARGDLLVGAGQFCQVFPGFHDTEPPLEPWDIVPVAAPPPAESSVRSDHTRENSIVRGRHGKASTLPPIFGRGDEDGFPALGGSVSAASIIANLAGSKYGRPRTYSPASFRHYRFEYSATHTESHSHSKAGGTVDQLAHASGEGKTRNHKSHHNDKSVSRARKQPAKVIGQIIEDDISMHMRNRVIRGYGLGDPRHNLDILHDIGCDDSTLLELWAWIHHSKELVFTPSPRVNKFDFSYQGLLGIWEGFTPSSHQSESSAPTPRNYLLDLPPIVHTVERSHSSSSRPRHLNPKAHSPAPEVHDDFHVAVQVLSARRGIERAPWSPSVPTTKLGQRRFALQLCGWSLRDDDLNNAIKKWEKEDKHSRAACWLVFVGQYTNAVDLLMRSKDESHRMMSGTLTALTPGTPKSPELRDQCERLIVRLDDPYFRALLTQLTSRDWSEVLEEEALPLRERLAIAFQFLEDKALSSYLRRIVDRSSARGDIEGIIVAGLTSSGMDILQSYVDRTGDIQTAAILSSFVSPAKFKDGRVLRWLDAYRSFLDGLKLFHHRVHFDIQRGQILQDAVQNGDVAPFEWAPPQILIRCNYCNKSISTSGLSTAKKSQATACPHCGRSLPRCSICLMTLGILQDSERDAELAHSNFKDTIDEAIVICQSCRHGGHASHILEWFFGEDGARSHGTCAIADCNCPCADEL